MTIFCALLALLVVNLVITITSLYDLTVYSYSLPSLKHILFQSKTGVNMIKLPFCSFFECINMYSKSPDMYNNFIN